MTQNASTTKPTKVITPEAQLSYPHVHTAQAGDDGKPAKYSAVLVFAPGADLKKLEAAVLAAAVDFFGEKVKTPGGPIDLATAFREGVLKSPFRKDAIAKGYPAGSIFINARTTQAPGLVYGYVDQATGKPAIVPPALIKDVFYAGAIVRGSVTAFGYDKEGNKGVSFALNNLQFLKDGTRLDNRVSAEDEFDAPMTQAPADLAGLI